MIRKLTNICLLMILTMLSLSMISFADESPTVIRVGYVDNYGTINSPLVSGHEGYGYEYLNTLTDYTDGNYKLEFVQCTWDNAYTKLRSREIDLLGPVTADGNLTSEFSYMDNPIGTNTLFLTSTGNETINTATYNRLNGSKIGISGNDYGAANLYTFLDKYDVQATVLLLSDEDTATVFDDYRLDYYIVSAFQMSSTEDFNVLAQIDTYPVYFISTPENQDLLDDLNRAYDKIQENLYLYEEHLYLKYYDYDTTSNNYISSEEYDILQDKDMYYVGVRDLHSPFSKTNDEGEPTGMAKDFINILSEAANLNIKMISIDDTTSQEILDMLDFYLFPTNTSPTQKLSIPYLDIPLLLVEHNTTLDESSTIGILTYYGIDSMKENERIFGRQVYEYDNLAAMKDAFNANQLSSMIVTTASLNYIRRDIEETDFLSTTLTSDMALTVTYADGFPQAKIDILNKIIGNLDSADLTYALMKASSSTANITLSSLVKDYPLIIICSVAAIGIILILNEYLKRRALNKQFNYDSLTGLYSQHKFSTEVQKRLKSHPHQSFQLISLDVDNFKYINEIYGYDIGSLILKRLSSIIQDSLDDDAIFCRAYADNFLLFVPRKQGNYSLERHIKSASSLNNELSLLLGTNYNFSFSVGIYNLPNNKGELTFMIDCVNLAREIGKKTVGTTFHTFSEEINIERIYNNEIAASMEQALINKEFCVHYQSKIDLNTEQLAGAEALVRWKRNDKLIPPSNFIPLFEKNGFILKLDLYVLDQVCEFLNHHKGLDIPKISVNLSGVTVASTNIVTSIMQILDQYQVTPKQLDIEITETAFVDTGDSLATISKLEELGFTVSMDDFGAGISSLNRLKNLKLDTLKIDREFIVDYLGNEKGTVILKSVLDMANSLHIETVAEGIETREQLESLRLYGCDIGQGFYFSRPISAEKFLHKYFNL